MSTLYRKYRPKNFTEVVGQNHIKVTLQNEIQSGKIAHAYLFCGPRAVGKTTVARVFSKAVNCLKRREGEYEPCNKCEICAEINSFRSLDIFEIDAASHTGVDNVRENIIASARMAPSRCKYKVFIIDEVHMLSISAFNALLKIIEEPPEFVIFILCTTEVHKVPTTIISRCQRFDFKRISVSDIVKKLGYIIKQEKISIDKKILESIARHSDGYQRDAEGLLGQIVAIAGPEHSRGGGKAITQEEADLVIPRSDISEIVNLIDFINKKNIAAGIALINRLVDDGVDLKKFTADLIEVLRKILLTKINPGLAAKLGLELGESLEIKISEVSRDLSVERLVALIEEFMKTKNEIKTSHIAQLPLELSIARLCLGGEFSSSFSPGPAPAPAPAQNNPASPAFGQAKSGGAKINKDDLAHKWNEVLAKVKKYNHSLSFILRACQPLDIKGNQVCLAFKYKLHKDRVNNMEIKNLIERVLTEVYGQPLRVEATIDENLKIETQINSNLPAPEADLGDSDAKTEKESGGQNMLSDLLNTFGGKVIK